MSTVAGPREASARGRHGRALDQVRDDVVLVIGPGDYELFARLGVAVLAGLAVGIEREWSGHASGPAARFAGVRTFLLLGLLGGIAGWLASISLAPLAIALAAGGAALTVAAYVMAVPRAADGIDGTTETAALVVLALGVVAGLDHLAIASGATALVVLALAEKTRLHALVQRIGGTELRAAMHFAVLALVILPLLPEGPYGPLGGVRPRALWQIVLLFTGLNFLGYLARRAVGQHRGYGVTGLLGGLISSTAVTVSFARRSREEPGLSPSLAFGVIAACTVLVPRVAVVSALLEPRVTLALVAYLAPALLVGAAAAIIALRRAPNEPRSAPVNEPKSPLRLWSAIQMAIVFQVVLMLVEWVRATWGASGILTSAAIIGLTDVDALTLAMARLGSDPARTALAALAIAIGVLSNTLMKLVLALALGTAAFRRFVVPGLLALVAAAALGLWAGRAAADGIPPLSVPSASPALVR